jgi:SAM-dependent methyltransferase
MAIERSGVDPEQFCFLDIGCGKGRALIIATEYGFKDLIGVDYSAKLC